MLTPFVLFFGLTIATAVIAYWADNLGKKLGKKRVSLWGMRPRTTATLLTIASSWGIMLFTLAVLLAAYPPLADALTKFESEKHKADDAILSAQHAQERADALGQSNALLAKKNQAAQGLLAAKTRTIGGLERDIEAAQTRLKGTSRALKNANYQEVIAKKGEATARERLFAIQSRFASVTSQLAGAQGRLRSVQGQLGSVQANLATARRTLASASRTLASTARLAAISAKEAARATVERNRAQAAVESLNMQQKVLEARSVTLNKQIADLQKDVAQSDTYSTIYAVGSVRIPVGQVMAEHLFAARPSDEEFEAGVQSLLANAQTAVAKNMGDKEASVRLATPGRGEKQPSQAEIDAYFGLLKSYVLSPPAMSSVRLVAIRNVLAGEKTVWLRFLVAKAHPAFEKGAVLAAESLDGHQSDAQLFRALLDLLDTGREAAERAGIDPPQSPDEPNFYAKDTNESIFLALRRLQALGRSARVRVVAAQDLSTVEPLRVLVEVE